MIEVDRRHFETGRLLIDAKKDLDHGEWLKMIESKLPFKRNMAERLMIIAGNPLLSKGAHGPNLPPSWRTLYELTKLPEPELRARLKDGSIHPKMERKDVAALRGDRIEARGAAGLCAMAADRKAATRPQKSISTEGLLPETDPGEQVARRWRKKLATDEAFAIARAFEQHGLAQWKPDEAGGRVAQIKRAIQRGAGVRSKTLPIVPGNVGRKPMTSSTRSLPKCRRQRGHRGIL